MIRTVPSFILFTMPLIAILGRAAVTLASLFTDWAVLQHGLPIPVWGTAASGERVTVEFAGQTAQAIADARGRWLARLPALSARAVGQDLVVRGENELRRPDVHVGEVWLAGGQSNMESRLAKASGGQEAVMAADDPQLHFSKVAHATTATVQDAVQGE